MQHTDIDIQMVDLKTQYQHIVGDIAARFEEIFSNTAFIGGPAVRDFQEELEAYLGVRHVIPCANGTDALQIALMALGLKPGDEVIVPSFTFVASVEVIGLMGLTPVLADVDPRTFNLDTSQLQVLISERTKAIMPVHLFGQCCDMPAIQEAVRGKAIYIIEDNAQSIGATCQVYGESVMSGTIGDLNCMSFYPSKNLGCYGDGGALSTNNSDLANLARSITNHGMSERYYHERLGVNSRLDAFQAAVLSAKLPHLDDYAAARQGAAQYYNTHLSGVEELILPMVAEGNSHVYHQYTIRIVKGDRNALKAHLAEHGVPSMIYYPVPTQEQNAFRDIVKTPVPLDVTNVLCQQVLSLPMHSELTEEQLDHICNAVKDFFN